MAQPPLRHAQRSPHSSPTSLSNNGTTGPSLTKDPCECPASMASPRVVIVGGGIAGLGAASTLAKRGLTNLVILEAQGRPGGRIFTQNPFGDKVLEFGAQWIHGQVNNPLYQLAKEKGLLAPDVDAKVEAKENYYFTEEGKLLSSSQAEKVSNYFEDLMDKINDDDFEPEDDSWSVGQYVDKEFNESTASDIRNADLIYEWCKRSACLDEASNSLYESSLDQPYVALEGPFLNSLGPKGYQGLLDIFIGQLPPNSIRCNKPVKRIQWQGTTSGTQLYPVKVICEDGEEFPADHVITTVSLGCLKARATAMFDPPLPKAKMDAITRLSFGTVAKIFLEFSEAFWPEDCAGINLVWEEGPETPEVYTESLKTLSWRSEWHKRIVTFDCVANQKRTLCGWITGLAAEHMETLPESEVADVCVGLLKQFTTWPVSPLRRIMRTTWHSNPYTRGSYTTIRLGVEAEKELAAMQTPLPPPGQSAGLKPLQVLFAGEATHPTNYTTTHGAYLTGVREAERIIKMHGL